MSDIAPAKAIRDSLAPFERGGKGDLPEAWLTFHDETEHVKELHEAEFLFTREDGGGMRVEGGDVTYLDVKAIGEEMAERDVRRWAVRFADLEPDLTLFAGRFVRDLETHPVSGGFGLWLNPLGRWDWWDLGGRFNGRITGERRPPGRTASLVSSGPSRGRTVLASIQERLTDALCTTPPPEVVVGADDDIEMVSRLLEDARTGRDHAFPGAVLLPPGSVPNEMRWLRSWPEIQPAETVTWLGLTPSASWKQVIAAAYARFPDHWAAGVAFHL